MSPLPRRATPFFPRLWAPCSSVGDFSPDLLRAIFLQLDDERFVEALGLGEKAPQRVGCTLLRGPRCAPLGVLLAASTTQSLSFTAQSRGALMPSGSAPRDLRMPMSASAVLFW